MQEREMINNSVYEFSIPGNFAQKIASDGKEGQTKDYHLALTCIGTTAHREESRGGKFKG